MKTRLVTPLAAAALLAALPLAAQASREDIEALKKRVDALQKQVDELQAQLKAHLGGTPAAPRAPSGPQPGVLVGTASAPVKGAAGAKVTIVEFSDYQCPFCARFHNNTAPQIQKEYIETGKARHVFRSLPLEAIHPQAFKAHEAALCAGDQGKYWEMHDKLFANQRALAPEQLAGHASAIGADAGAFKKCLDSEKHAARIREDLQEASKLGISGTPAFLIGVSTPDGKVKNVRFINGARPYADFKAAIDAALAAQ